MPISARCLISAIGKTAKNDFKRMPTKAKSATFFVSYFAKQIYIVYKMVAE